MNKNLQMDPMLAKIAIVIAASLLLVYETMKG
jgi:hypothetical protein